MKTTFLTPRTMRKCSWDGGYLSFFLLWGILLMMGREGEGYPLSCSNGEEDIACGVTGVPEGWERNTSWQKLLRPYHGSRIIMKLWRYNYGMEDCCLPLLCKDDTGSPSYSVRTVVTILQASDLDALQKCCHTNTSGTGYGFRTDLCNAALESVKVLTCWNGSNRTWEVKMPCG